MTTTRIHFEAALDPEMQLYTQFHIEAPGQIQAFTPKRPLKLLPHKSAIDNYKANNGAADNIVGDIGDALWACLSDHPNANNAFLPTLRPGAPGRMVSLSFSPETADAKELPWEALRENAEFLCFDMRVPIVREVETAAESLPLTLADGEKVRFLAVIAAEGDDGRGEWDALLRAVKSVGEDLPIEVLVLTSNNAIAEDIEQNESDIFLAGPVPDGAASLKQRIQAFGPHIAHFFCHGHAKGFLELERSSAEWGAGEPTWLSVTDLEEALSLSAALTVLNACSLAAVGDANDKPSGCLNLCEQLVQRGFPIVVGMRAAVNAGDAHAFAESFHTKALAVLSQQFAVGGGNVSLAESFGDACRAILSMGPPMDSVVKSAWTFPVMNVRPTPLQLERLQTADAAGLAGADLSLDARIDHEEAQSELAALELVLRDHAQDFAGSIEQIKERIDQIRNDTETGN